MQDNIRLTNDDAITSKLSAVNAGYIQDEFVSILLKRGQKRAPIINRGTFVRCFIIDQLIQTFIEKHDRNCQIISLGAGSDTRWFNLKSKQIHPLRYAEVDLEQTTVKKAMQLCRNQKSKSLLGDCKIEGSGLYSNEYFLIAGDLRQFDSILTTLFSLGFQKDIPTLFLSECVLIYLDPLESDKIVTSAGTTFINSAFITYEQIEPYDPFGQQMLQNLSHRGLALPGIQKYPTIDAQRKRYIQAGFHETKVSDLKSIWDEIPLCEKQRISKLEIFDEVEEWELLMKHYCLVFACKY